MRVWDIYVRNLCDKHLLGQHREIHAIWNIHTKDRKGYRHHPEVKRWKNCLAQLKMKHDATAQEMKRRKFNHQSPLPNGRTDSETVEQWESTEVQIQKLRAKGCACRV